MRRKIPSTAALAAFESAARHGSFTRAADELAVTQSAVCRQIASLEAMLGVKLFRRSRRGVMLTEAGSTYGPQVRQRLQDIERDSLELAASRGAGGALELAVVPTFGTRWLLPRLPRFAGRHPGITLHLHSRIRPFLFADSGLDAALHAGNAPWPGTEAVPLLPEEMVAVASPTLAQDLARRVGGRAGALAPPDVARVPLLQMATRPHAWRQWFHAQGVQVEGDLAGARMEIYGMLAEAAVHGLGAALIPSLLIEDELRSRRLVPLTPYRLASGNTYSLILPEAHAERPALVALRDWLREEAARYLRAEARPRRRVGAGA